MSAAALLERLRAALAADERIAQASVWDGAWDALAATGRVSIRPPAAFVALVGWHVENTSQSPVHPRQLVSARDADRLGADPSGAPAPSPVLRCRIGAAILTAGATAEQRAAEAALLATAAAPALLAAGLTGLSGRSVYSEALQERGLATQAILGEALLEVAPAAVAARTPDRVLAAVNGAPREVVWPERGA